LYEIPGGGPGVIKGVNVEAMFHVFFPGSGCLGEKLPRSWRAGIGRLGAQCVLFIFGDVKARFGGALYESSLQALFGRTETAL